jgi:hypothetical protein
MANKTDLRAILDNTGRVVEWAYLSATEFMLYFFNQCSKLNSTHSMTEEESRYSRSVYLYRNKRNS